MFMHKIFSRTKNNNNNWGRGEEKENKGLSGKLISVFVLIF
jgi:hypothetical protein